MYVSFVYRGARPPLRRRALGRCINCLMVDPSQGNNPGMKFNTDLKAIKDAKRATHVVIGIEYGKT